MQNRNRNARARGRGRAPAAPPPWVPFVGGWLTGAVCVLAANPLWTLLGDLVRAPAPVAAATAPEMRWQFDEALRETEVPVAAPPAPATAAPAARAAQPAAVAVSRERPMLLQAGSFRGRDDAERLRGELLQRGFTAVNVSEARIDGAQYHRVMLGPFTSAAEMRAARAKLSTAHITALETGVAP
jgi:cell division protein FtsN